jgi:LCP family protein required for cell wall assembly
LAETPPEYTLYRSRPRGLRERLAGNEAPVREPKRTRQPRAKRSRRGGIGRIVKIVVFALVGWVGLSLVLFSISAQTRAGQGISDSAQAKLDKGGLPPLTATNILVLGSDRRPRGSKEPGAFGAGERSDTIMLLRVGGGSSSKLSIPRDTVVPIPGHGIYKINAAYAYGGAALSIETIESWTGVTIDHLVEIDLENFPKFIDALGGITVATPCVISDINGGKRNGGYSLRLKRGENDLDGKAALAYARTRKNRCNAAYNDLSRARAQQQILGGVRGRVLSVGGFLHLPWASWNAPQAIRTDMGAAGLLGVMSSIAVAGSPPPQVMKPTGAVVLPNGGAGLVVDEQSRRRAIDRFMNG